jgi:aspartate kinase
VDMIVSRYEDIAKELGCYGEIIDLIASDIKNRLNTAVGNRAKFIDLLKAAGEDNCARLVAAYFNATGVEAYYVNLPSSISFLKKSPIKIFLIIPSIHLSAS